MRCLFCKEESSSAKSVEHIVPESLGNKSFVLSRGYICDKCNNYFARQVEKPFLEHINMRLLRFYEAIPNKKNKIPTINGIIDSIPVILHKDFIDGEIVTGIDIPPDVFDDIVKKGDLSMIIPALLEDCLPASNSITSRFIAKIALEALADRLKGVENSLDDLIDDRSFDAIRNHARLGAPREWPCSIRRIYATNAQWKTADNETSQIIHECDFLLPNICEYKPKGDIIESELYFIVALWGIEFAINMGGPEIDGYNDWLRRHNNASPLYYGKNQPSEEYGSRNYIH